MCPKRILLLSYCQYGKLIQLKSNRIHLFCWYVSFKVKYVLHSYPSIFTPRFVTFVNCQYHGKTLVWPLCLHNCVGIPLWRTPKLLFFVQHTLLYCCSFLLFCTYKDCGLDLRFCLSESSFRGKKPTYFIMNCDRFNFSWDIPLKKKLLNLD